MTKKMAASCQPLMLYISGLGFMWFVLLVKMCVEESHPSFLLKAFVVKLSFYFSSLIYIALKVAIKTV